MTLDGIKTGAVIAGGLVCAGLLLLGLIAIFTLITMFLLGDIALVTWKVALWISIVVVMILVAIHNR